MKNISIPGFQVYYVYIGERVSISIKPTDKSGPLITLDSSGRWMSPRERAIYKVDSDGALWKHGVAKKNNFATYVPLRDQYVPANHLASKKT